MCRNMIAVAEFSGRCRGNPARISKFIHELGGRVTSYIPETSVIMGFLRINVLDPQEVEKKCRLFTENVAGSVDDCRIWIRISLDAKLGEALRKMESIKLSSNTTNVSIVKLANNVYALWRRRRTERTKLTLLSQSVKSHPGDLSELSVSCGELHKLLSSIREDFLKLVESEK
ncbi:MAG: hypothetical protein RMH84_05195 [Sulfolobales archaeon]|nr:hypothetical protein [Sulfolobales archaeon]MCX8208915.1 hypothetical protein [Sulfolobales archaeon]MDW8010970.1 hypothetical protein [Sulfolobales archaeon]